MNDSNPVQFTVTSNPLPGGWLNQDVGTVNAAGSATYSGGVFTLSSTSIGLGGISDGFHFVFQPLMSDGTVIARVVGIQPRNKRGSCSAKLSIPVRRTYFHSRTLRPFRWTIGAWLVALRTRVPLEA
jgi:hypothetical protein